MSTLLKRTTKEDQKIALESITSLSKTSQQYIKGKESGVQIKIQESNEYITIPKKALSLLLEILSNMAEGKSITLIPSDSEVTTQQAADILNVSRPHIIKLLQNGEISFRKVGSHRRIQLKDIIEYEKKLKKSRRKNLEFLANQAQDLNLGY